MDWAEDGGLGTTGSNDAEHLIELIYAAALAPQTWPDVLAHLLEAVGGAAAALSLLTPASGISAQRQAHRQIAAISGYNADDVASYMAHFAQDDARQRQLSMASVGQVLADGIHLDVVPYHRTLTFNEFFVPRRLEQGMGVSLLAGDDRIAIASIMREAGRGPFDPAAAALLQRLTPHLRRALQVHERLSEAMLVERGLQEAIDHMPLAVVVLQGGGRVVRLNRAADRMLSRPGAPLTVRHGRLATSGPTTGRLGPLLAATATSDIPPPIVRLAGADGTTWTAMAAPVAPGAIPGYGVDRTHLLFVCESGAGWAVDPVRVAALFGLTQAEAVVAAGLVAGRSPQEIAHSRGASVSTVRSQLRSLFNKTGTHAQGQLVALVARSLVMLEPPTR